jgi:hypothetical protein
MSKNTTGLPSEARELENARREVWRSAESMMMIEDGKSGRDERWGCVYARPLGLEQKYKKKIISYSTVQYLVQGDRSLT